MPVVENLTASPAMQLSSSATRHCTALTRRVSMHGIACRPYNCRTHVSHCSIGSQSFQNNGSSINSSNSTTPPALSSSSLITEPRRKSGLRDAWQTPHSRPTPAVHIPNLKADDIRHPLDRQNTALLRGLPGLDSAARFLLAPIQEELLLLETLASSVQVSEKQLPNLYSLLLEASRLLDMPPPDLYVRQSPEPNAYTLALGGRRPFIVVHTSLLDLLPPPETQAVLAHELAHLKCDHGLWLNLANAMALGASLTLPGPLGSMLGRNLEEQLLRWARAAELTCDRAAMLVAQDPRVVVAALMRLAGGTTVMAADMCPDAFLAQASAYDEAVAGGSPIAWWLRNARASQLTHPLPVLRAREVDRWARGEEYAALLARGRPAKAVKT